MAAREWLAPRLLKYGFRQGRHRSFYRDHASGRIDFLSLQASGNGRLEAFLGIYHPHFRAERLTRRYPTPYHCLPGLLCELQDRRGWAFSEDRQTTLASLRQVLELFESAGLSWFDENGTMESLEQAKIRHEESLSPPPGQVARLLGILAFVALLILWFDHCMFPA
ncbi:MAG: DUF4304 domain-containing protein [Myxococcota bacterium]|nr:DUF4304 domain-containing protein [Myxococcota bacterium]